MPDQVAGPIGAGHMTLQRLINSWNASIDLHSFRSGVTHADCEAFEQEAGWRLPHEWRELYTFTDGARLLDDNIFFNPLGGERGFLNQSDYLRGHGWLIPDELCVVGSDGEGNQIGLWLPAMNDQTAPVVEVGQNFEPHCVSILGSSLGTYLLHRTVYFLLDSPYNVALDALDVPQAFRWWDTSKASGADRWDEIGKWVDPAWSRPGWEVPDVADPAWADCTDLDAEEVNDILGCA